ncbi:Growth_factor receptor cysteine-rich domain superfamily [Hexamita inflata]|uniref:Growth factor receptor cysteine-rich domain superfamily n=1 Tax=Hexamita inflata TaxID=28002 RepID=A0AA86NA45_9EUKA|nr:Growth factor receptor cysteine-rich domain superfamily [Hexamita inflata]
MKSSKIQLNLYQVNQFAVFGFNSNYQQLEESQIYVKINYSILTGALLCLECDILVKCSELQFIANGLQLSALIIKSKDIIQLEKVNISYRFSCNSSSGIANQILKNIIQFSVNNVILTGYNDIVSSLNGYYSSKVDVDINIQLSQMYVCVDMATQRIGQTQKQIITSSVELQQCNLVCTDNQYYFYGLCQEIIQFSVLLSNDTVVCDHPFEFDNFSETCVCMFGYYLNDTVCVHVVSELSEITVNMQLLDSKLQAQIISSQIEMKQLIYNLEVEIQTTVSNISELIQSSYTNLQLDIINVNETLREQFNNLKTDVTQQFKLSSDQNTQTQSIINNFRGETSNELTRINAQINDNQLNIKNNFTQTNQKIDSVNTQINAVVTNNQFQTQIDLLKQQIQSISVSISQSMTNDQLIKIIKCIYYAGSYSGSSSSWYVSMMSQYGCAV